MTAKSGNGKSAKAGNGAGHSPAKGAGAPLSAAGAMASTEEPVKNISAQAASPSEISEKPPIKRGPGKPKGLPKTGGRVKNKPSKMGREAREYLAKHSNYLEIISRICAGKSVKMSGPTGKQRWFHPEWADRRWALEIAVSKLLPTMAASELSGPDQEPLIPQVSERETARRLAWLLTRPGSGGEGIVAALTEGTDGSSVVSSPRSAGSGDAAVGDSTPCPPSGPPSSPPSRANGAADAAESTPPSPLSDRGAMASTEDPHFPDILKSGDPLSENFSSEKPAPKLEPAAGDTAYIFPYIVKCSKPSRPNLPLQYEIRDAASGALMKQAAAGWPGVLDWIRHRVPEGEDLEIDIRGPVRGALDDELGRPDQMESVAPRPEVRNSCGHRKRR